MLHEVETAVKFLADFLRPKSNHHHHGRQTVKTEQVEEFARRLKEALLGLFTGHWHPLQPMRGSGYRCIINQSANGTVDPTLLRTGRRVGIPEFLLRRYLPVEMAVWIDPNDVSYRIGEQGSICSLYGSPSEKENRYPNHHSSVSPVAFGGGRGSRKNSLTICSPDKASASSTSHLHHHIHQQQQQHQHQYQHRHRPESLRMDSTTTMTMTTMTTTTTTTKGPQPSEHSNDSGIELSPSTSPRPSTGNNNNNNNNTISNSSSPNASPLSSPVREQQPALGMQSCKEQFASHPVGSFSSSVTSPSKVGVSHIHATPLSPLVR